MHNTRKHMVYATVAGSYIISILICTTSMIIAVRNL